jgi:hypothetical protein
MTTHYIATFADGAVLTRSTANRTYSTAWRVPSSSRVGGYEFGWSRTPALAVKAAGNVAKYNGTAAEYADAVQVPRRVRK